MSQNICSVEDCQREVHCRSMCYRHYRQCWDAERAAHPLAECSVDGCDRPVDSLGWCFAHYQRDRLTGDVQAGVPLRRLRQPSTLRPMTEIEVAWLAGWLEGEGCFSPRDNRGYKTIDINAKSIDLDVLEHVFEITGVGSVTGPQIYPDRSPIFNWGVRTKSDVLALIDILLPHMHARRSARIKELLEWAEWSVDQPLEQSKKV